VRDRPPFEARRLVAAPRLDDHVVGRLQHDALAGGEHVIVEIAAPRQPDAALQHGELAAGVFDAQRLAEDALDGAAGQCIELRIHHQSPVRGERPTRAPQASMMVLSRGSIQ
jgi:hypothetical protein